MSSDEQRGGSAVRLVTFPFRLAFAAVVAAFRLGWWTARVPARATVRTTRVLGFKAIVLFAAGLVIGLLFAPESGRELRAKLRRRIEGGVVSDAELADKVAFELAHAPRTWHLPQPVVTVAGGRVELQGGVPHERGRDELARVAAAVPGVREVDNLLTVDAAAAAG